MSNLDTLCLNCGHTEGQHANVGNFCPEGAWFSPTSRFCAIFCIVEDQHGYRCGREPAQPCVDCGCGVCIPCNLPCFECALPLHDHCRDEHAKSSGHRVDGPAGMPRLSQRPLTGTLIDELLAIGGAL